MPDTQWYEEGLQFTCTQCGDCCTGPPGYVLFTGEEAEAIAEYLNISLEEFFDQYTHKVMGAQSLQETKTSHGYDCIFLDRREDGTAGCSIYAVRPAQCRTWPFWPENIRTRRAWVHTQKVCPGSGQGKMVPVEQIRIMRDGTPKL